jgi:hypothetical protein
VIVGFTLDNSHTTCTTDHNNCVIIRNPKISQAPTDAVQQIHEKTQKPVAVLVVLAREVETKVLNLENRLRRLLVLMDDHIALMKACTALIEKEIDRRDDVRWLREQSWRRRFHNERKSHSHRISREVSQRALRAAARRPLRLIQHGNGHRI